MMIRGPGIPKNVTLHQIALSIDIAPTIVALSGQEPPPDMDGRSLTDLLFASNSSLPESSTVDDVPWRDDFLIDYHGEGEGDIVH